MMDGGDVRTACRCRDADAKRCSFKGCVQYSSSAPTLFCMCCLLCCNIAPWSNGRSNVAPGKTEKRLLNVNTVLHTSLSGHRTESFLFLWFPLIPVPVLLFPVVYTYCMYSTIYLYVWSPLIPVPVILFPVVYTANKTGASSATNAGFFQVQYKHM